MFTTSRNGTYIGLPFGISTDDLRTAYKNKAPDWGANPPMQLKANFPVPIMTYAEMLFIISEYKGFAADEYEEAVEASIDYWSSISGVSVSASAKAAYLDDVTKTVDAEAVALQKYIDLFMNGTEAWVEIRRTGYPDQLIKPGEIIVSALEDGTKDLEFDPLSDTKGLIIPRVKYPTNESTLNGANFNDAVKKLEDGTNNYYSPMFWDKRRENPHPPNK